MGENTRCGTITITVVKWGALSAQHKTRPDMDENHSHGCLQENEPLTAAADVGGADYPGCTYSRSTHFQGSRHPLDPLFFLWSGGARFEGNSPTRVETTEPVPLLAK